MEKELKVNITYSTEAETLEEAQEELEERFAIENTTAENEFWDNMELVEVKE